MIQDFGCTCYDLIEAMVHELEYTTEVISRNLDNIEDVSNIKIKFLLYILSMIKNAAYKCNCEHGRSLNHIYEILSSYKNNLQVKDLSIDDLNEIYNIVIDNLLEERV